MKLKIVSKDGTAANTFITNAETGEKIDNVQEIIIRGKGGGLITAQIKLTSIAIDMVAEKKKRTKPPKIFSNPTDYSISCISNSEKTVMDGEGAVDLEYVKNHGIDPSDKLSWYLWKFFVKTFSENKLVKIKTSDIVEFIRRDFGTDQNGVEFKFDRTTTNHCINKFYFIGLLHRQKKVDECVYTFTKMVKRRGMEWFRSGNRYLKGHFQSDANGLFNLMEETDGTIKR